MEHEEILKILQKRVEAARVRSYAERLKFNATIADVPSGLPHPDGVTRMRLVHESYHRALRDLSDAQEQMTEFLLKGTVPEDLEHGYLN